MRNRRRLNRGWTVFTRAISDVSKRMNNLVKVPKSIQEKSGHRADDALMFFSRRT